MTVERRIRMCLLIERIKEHKELSERLGIEDRSSYHGKRIYNGGEKTC